MAMTPNTDAVDRGLFRLGAISALVLGAGYLVIFPLFAYVGAPPSGRGEVWLAYLAGKTRVWWAILGISVLTDFLFIPIAFALYVALKDVNRNAMMIAAAFVGLFVAVDLAVTWSNYAALLTLSANYETATSDVQRAAYVVAAGYPSAVLGSRVAVIYAIATLSFAILVIGFVMLDGVFSRTTAYLGIATGVLGLVSLAGWGVTIILNAVFATVWLFFVGFGLLRLARR
jgi:hypothetical protein